ncbi:MAG: hypothetical protein U5N85_05910 [Arcicella sp.]|nr:hypothetical protein [Arcicella sp.]
MKVKIFIIIFSSILFSSCLFDSDSNKIIGDYETVWIDNPQTRSINKGEEIVHTYVSEIGHNSNFIISKRQPIKQGNIVIVHIDTTNYYIINVSTNSFQDKPVYGPLSKNSFDSLRKELKSENIKFAHSNGFCGGYNKVL